MGRGELGRMGKLRNSAVAVVSPGIHPENHIPPLLAQRLKRDGIDPLADPLLRFTPEDANKANITIAFDEAAQAPGLEKARTWQVAAWNSQYDDAKSDTVGNVNRLLHELFKRPC